MGVVRDTGGIAIDSVELFFPELNRRVVTNAEGRFRLTDVAEGKYKARARRFGYLPQGRTISVVNTGGSVTFELFPFPVALPPVITTVSRGGLSGVVGDTAYQALAGATVDVIGSHRTALTDEQGQFFVDLKPGRYTVAIKRDSFATRMLTVIVPEDSGRRVTVWLRPRAEKDVRELERLGDLRTRTLVASAVYDFFYARDDVTRLDPGTLEYFISLKVPGAPVTDCYALINGGPDYAPAWSISADELEMVEIHVIHAKRSRVVHIDPRNTRGGVSTNTSNPGVTYSVPSSGSCPANVYAWLRN